MTAYSLAIIAGGQSRRMGQDKAFVRLHGKAMIEHVILVRRLSWKRKA